MHVCRRGQRRPHAQPWGMVQMYAPEKHPEGAAGHWKIPVGMGQEVVFQGGMQPVRVSISRGGSPR